MAIKRSSVRDGIVKNVKPLLYMAVCISFSPIICDMVVTDMKVRSCETKKLSIGRKIIKDSVMLMAITGNVINHSDDVCQILRYMLSMRIMLNDVFIIKTVSGCLLILR